MMENIECYSIEWVQCISWNLFIDYSESFIGDSEFIFARMILNKCKFSISDKIGAVALI